MHAFVRSKVLQIWLAVIQARALPLPRYQTIVELVIGRLHDKSSSVRKYAIQVVTALLRNNPFADNVSHSAECVLCCVHFCMGLLECALVDVVNSMLLYCCRYL